MAGLLLEGAPSSLKARVRSEAAETVSAGRVPAGAALTGAVLVVAVAGRLAVEGTVPDDAAGVPQAARSSTPSSRTRRRGTGCFTDTSEVVENGRTSPGRTRVASGVAQGNGAGGAARVDLLFMK